jgi:hypothetical protein
VIRSLVTRLRIDAPLTLIREKWLDFKLATINPQAPHLHELLIARADITRPMAQKGKTR